MSIAILVSSIEISLMLTHHSPSISYCSGLPTGYQLSTIRSKVDDPALDPFTSTSLSDSSDFLNPFIRKSHANEDYTTIRTNGKRHNPYINTQPGSKKFKDGRCNIFGEVITPLSSQSGNLLSPPLAATFDPLRNPSCRPQVWIDILEEPEEVNK